MSPYQSWYLLWGHAYELPSLKSRLQFSNFYFGIDNYWYSSRTSATQQWTHFSESIPKSSVTKWSYILTMILVTPIRQIWMTISHTFQNQLACLILFCNENDPYFLFRWNLCTFSVFFYHTKVFKIKKPHIIVKNGPFSFKNGI